MQPICGVPAGGGACEKSTAPRYAPAPTGLAKSAKVGVRALGANGTFGSSVAPATHSTDLDSATPEIVNVSPPINCVLSTSPEVPSTCATYAEFVISNGLGRQAEGTAASAGRLVLITTPGAGDEPIPPPTYTVPEASTSTPVPPTGTENSKFLP